MAAATAPKPTNKGVISRDEFERLDPSEIEVFVVKPVKRITALLSHVVRYCIVIYLF